MSKTAHSQKRTKELTQINIYTEVYENNVKFEKGAALPEVSLFGQYGFQGKDYSIDKKSDIAVAGVSLKWNLFTAGQRKSMEIHGFQENKNS